MEKLTTVQPEDYGEREALCVQILREYVERADESDIDRIFPQVSADCQNCQSKNVSCRNVRLDGEPQMLCEACFGDMVSSLTAIAYTDEKLFADCNIDFTSRAIGKTVTQVEN